MCCAFRDAVVQTFVANSRYLSLCLLSMASNQSTHSDFWLQKPIGQQTTSWCSLPCSTKTWHFIADFTFFPLSWSLFARIHKWIGHLPDNQRQTSPRLENCWTSLMETKCELAGTGGALETGRRQRVAAGLRHLPTQAPLLTDREKKREKQQQQQHPAITSFLD